MEGTTTRGSQEPVIAHLAYSTILKTVSPKFGLMELVVLERFFNEFPKWSNVKLSSAVVAILVGEPGHWTHSERGPPKDHSTKVWFQMSE